MTGHAVKSHVRLALQALAAFSVAAAPALADPTPNHATPINEAMFKALQWRGVGPYRGGRALAVTGAPGEPDTFYFGAVAGGVWKTTDAGNSWKPIFDSQPMSSIGAIAVAPSNPDIIYVGTGEGALRGDITYGDGVYRSADGGKSWSHIGLEDSRQIGALIVDPTNPDIVLVAAMGHAFGPNSERGIFRTTDAGKTWTKTLFRDDRTGAIDVTFDPTNPRIVYAAMWQAQRQPWTFSSGGPGSGLYRSSDGGATWTELKGHGLPAGILGRIDVSVSAADPHRIFAMIEAKEGGLYRSDDSGASWRRVSEDGRIRQRAWYFSKIYADPKSADTVYALNTGLLKSTDGGKTFGLVSATHGDHHGLWIDPTNPSRMINCNDGGASISLDGGLTWSTQDNQPTGQYYHVSVSTGWPYWIYGAQQDNSNVALASYDDEGVISDRDWFAAGGGESGFVVGDPRNPKIIYSDAENQFARYDKTKEQDQDISPWPVDNSGHPASELLHRFNWTSPLLLSPHNPDVLYAGSEVVWKSVDRGNSWTIISSDLTRDDKSKQFASGGPLTKDITSVEYYDTLFALAESPVKQGLLWAGSDDGLVHVTSDDGAHWTDVTPKEIPAWSTISMIEPSSHSAQVAYLAVDRHKLDDVKPYAYRTGDGGKSWTPITAGLPEGAVVHAVREDPVRQGLLYAATEQGVFVSFDDGGLWQSLKLNMPASPVHDLAIKGDDLVAATHGRSFWILDDVTPLRQIGPETDLQAVVLYAPQTALRLHYPDQVDSRRPVGANPPAGALIDYVLKAEPQGELTIDILGPDGAPVRHLSSLTSDKEVQPPEWPDQIVPDDRISAKAGMNRLVWDLRMSDPTQIPGAFYSGPTPRGPLVPPGRYLVKLSVGGHTLTEPLTVIADPRLQNAKAAIKAKTDLAVATEADIDRLHKAVNAVRKTRVDLARAKQSLAGKASAQSLFAEADRLDRALATIEQTLMQVNMKGSEANLAFPGMLNEQFASFALSLEDADTAPTTQHAAMYRSLHAKLDDVLTKWQALQASGLAPFDAKLEQVSQGAVRSR